MKQLPLAARIYVGAVIAGGALLLAALFPPHDFPHPLWFVTLLLLSSVTSAFKVNLPLARSGSTMSVSYAVDFLSLILLGPAQTMIVGARQRVEPVHVPDDDEEPAVPDAVQHGEPRHQRAGRGLRRFTRWAASRARVDAAGGDGEAAARRGGAYFLCNTALIATAIALSTHQPLFKVWNENFLWSAPSYFVGAVAAAGVSIVIGGTTNYWIALLAAPPLYLTYRSYKIYLGRIEDEQRHVQEVSDLHLATIEALALAIDAKDRTGKSHIRRVQVFAAGLARSVGHVGERDPGRQDGGAAARHRQAGRARAHPVEARAADAGRIPEDPHPSAGRRRDHRRRAVPLPGRAAHPQPPRAVGRQGIPGGLKGEEIPLGARILAVVDYFDALTSERPYHKAMTRRRRRRAAAAGSRQGARPEPRAALRREPRQLRSRSGDDDRSVRTLALPTGTSEKGRPAVGLLPGAVEQDGVRGHRARASRDLRALRNRAGDGHQPRRRRHDGAHLVEAEQPRAVLVLRAVPARRRARDAALPVRDRHRRRGHPADGGEERARA